MSDMTLDVYSRLTAEKMKNAALSNDVPEDTVLEINKGQMTQKMKVFLLAQAERELSNIIKLTDALDKIEDKFLSKVDNEADRMSIKGYADTIYLLTTLLDRSGKLIQSILHDDSITNLMIVDNSTNVSVSGDINSSNIRIPGMEDRHSRDKVRQVVETVIGNLQKMEHTPDDIVVEEEVLQDNEQSEFNGAE